MTARSARVWLGSIQEQLLKFEEVMTFEDDELQADMEWAIVEAMDALRHMVTELALASLTEVGDKLGLE